MRLMLSVFMIYMMVAQTFGLDFGLAPGLSVKNFVLYAILAGLVTNFAVRGGFKFDLIGLQACFVFLVVYALFSTFIADMVFNYAHYDLMYAIMRLKGLPFDFMAFFLVFFHGTKTEDDALALIKVILAVAIFGNLASVLHGLNIVTIDALPVSETGRVDGVMGERNQYGAYVAVFIPPLLAAAAMNTGKWRVIWGVGAIVSVLALITTVSRGAFAASLFSTMWGAYVFRRYVSVGKVVILVSIGIFVVALVLVSLDPKFGEMLAERLLGQSTGVDASDVSSGRTELWASAFEQMMQKPLTLITGFGWATYYLIPSTLPLAPHNTYLYYWFELGLPGMFVLAYILLRLIGLAKGAVERTSPALRAHLIGFAIGMAALAVAIFFVDLVTPWPYVWAYAGVVMKWVALTNDASPGTVHASSSQVSQERNTRAADRFGWTAAGRRR